MGYETTILAGTETTMQDKDGGIYFAVYASIDMCKLGSDSSVLALDWQNKNEEGDYWYHFHRSDGDTPTKEDCYGDKPKPVPMKDVIRALEVDIGKEEYRRLRWALGLLKEMANDDENMSVLLFGY